MTVRMVRSRESSLKVEKLTIRMLHLLQPNLQNCYLSLKHMLKLSNSLWPLIQRSFQRIDDVYTYCLIDIEA